MTTVAAALRRATAHLFVDSLDAPQLSAADEHHLLRVLRVRPTDPLTLSDGLGGWVEARWDPAAGGLVRVGEVQRAMAHHECTVACAIAKGDRPEWTVQKLTEVGVARIVLFEAERSVVRWDAERAARQLERLRKVAREAAMQSRRVMLPEVTIAPWGEVAALPAAALADPAAGDEIDATVSTVVVGPEGGFTDAELRAVGRTVGLGDQVLRVETAAIAAGVLLMAAHRVRGAVPG